jgi:hypothetical protein
METRAPPRRKRVRRADSDLEIMVVPIKTVVIEASPGSGEPRRMLWAQKYVDCPPLRMGRSTYFF